MESKKIKYFSGFVLIVTIVTLLLSIFYSRAFVTSFMLMLSLFLFSIAYMIKDNNKKMVNILFIVGVLLIIGSLVYMFMRLS